MLAEHQIRLPAVTLESADGKARAVLEKAQAAVGFIPKTPLVAHGETNIAPDEFGRLF